MTNFSLPDDPAMDNEFHPGDYIRVAGDPNLYCIDKVARTGYAVHDMVGVAHQLNDIDPDDITQEQNVFLWRVDLDWSKDRTPGRRHMKGLLFMEFLVASTAEEAIDFYVRDGVRVDPQYPRNAWNYTATLEASTKGEAGWIPLALEEKLHALWIIRHPNGTWGLQRGDRKIMMIQRDHSGLVVWEFPTETEAEAQCLILNPLTTEQRHLRGVF